MMKLFSLFRRFVDSKENIFTKETAKLRFFLIPTQQADRLRGVSLNWEQQPTFHLVISVFFWVFTLGMIYFFSFFPDPPSELNGPAKPSCDAFCRLLCSEIKMLGRPGIKATSIELKESWLICYAVKS